MNTHAALVVATAVTAGSIAANCSAIVAGRAIRQCRARQREHRRKRVESLVLSWTDANPIDVALPADRHDRQAATAFALELAPKLRGADRDTLVAVLVRLGVAARARADTASRRATRRLRGACVLDVLARPADADILTKLVADHDRQIRIVAARAVGRIGVPSAVPLLLAGLSSRALPANTVSMAIVRIGPAANTDLLAAQRSHDALTRSVTAELLGYLDATHACRRLIEALDDSEANVVTAAATALGRLRLTESEMALRYRLASEYAVEQPDLAVCVALVTALGRVGDRRAVPILTASLNRSHRLSLAASTALETMGARRSPTSERLRALEDARTIEVGTRT